MIMKILCALIGYVLGSVSAGMLISRAMGKDLRSAGSHNTGATNALRVLGTKAGVTTFMGDFAKAAIAVLLGKLLYGARGGMIAGLFAVIGHNWPVFFEFKGGKGVACTVAVILLMNFKQGAIAGILCLAVIALTKYVSLGSLVMVTSFAFLMLLRTLFRGGSLISFVWALLLMALVFYRHKENIQRLKNGNERKLGEKA